MPAANASLNRLTFTEPIIDPLMAKKDDVNAQHIAVKIPAISP
jgi:hypothetical protein